MQSTAFKQKTITRSEMARLAFTNSKRLPLAVSDSGVRKEWVGVGWIDCGMARGDETRVIETRSKLKGRFGIVFAERGEVMLFGEHCLWRRRKAADFHLQHSRGYATPDSELHSAYVGELGKDFWLKID